MIDNLKLIVNYKGKHRIMYVRDYNVVKSKGEDVQILAKEYDKKFDEYLYLMTH